MASEIPEVAVPLRPARREEITFEAIDGGALTPHELACRGTGHRT